MEILQILLLNVDSAACRPLIFFKAKKLGIAQLENLALLGVAAITMGAFYKVDQIGFPCSAPPYNIQLFW